VPGRHTYAVAWTTGVQGLRIKIRYRNNCPGRTSRAPGRGMNINLLYFCVCSLLCLLSTPGLSAQSLVTVDSVTPLIGTWQILNLVSSAYFSAEDKSVKYVQIQFGNDGTYRRIIQRIGTDSTSEGVKPIGPESYDGTYFTDGDTIRVHWQDPDYGDDYSAQTSFRGDTLLLRRIDLLKPPFKLLKVVDTAEVENHNYAQNIPVPAELVDKLKRFRTKDSPGEIMWELFNIIRPGDSVKPEWDFGYLRVMVSNLDTDVTPEILCLTGYSMSTGYVLLVLKSFSTNWRIIYERDMDFAYKDPEIHILDNHGPTRTFYTYEVTDHGSGIYRDLFRFFKLINGRVYDCLSAVHEMHLTGWTQLNREIVAKVKSLHNGKDEISLRYKFHFWPGNLKDSSTSEETHDDISFVSGTASLDFLWDSRSRTYRPIFSADGTGLTSSKFKCLDSWFDDPSFVNAYQTEIQDVLKKGSKKQILLLNALLREVKRDSVSLPAAGGL